MLTRRFSPLNRYEYASILCSLLIIVFPFVDQYMFQLYSDGFLSYITAFFPYLLMCAMFMGAFIVYVASGGRINPV